LRIRTLLSEQWLPCPIEEIFAFFSDAHNLDLLTPAWLHFRILTPPPIPMQQGTTIEYRLRWRGVPLFWRTQIAVWEPPVRFVDQQTKGPYRQWIHEHTFKARDGGTLMRDRVDYAIPGWIVEPILDWLIVGRDVRLIFEYRSKKMTELFGERTPSST
jgi:hypothetical protein